MRKGCRRARSILIVGAEQHRPQKALPKIICLEIAITSVPHFDVARNQGITMRKTQSVAAALSILSAGAANAADLPAPVRMAEPTIAPAYNWTGLYFGVNGGYGWGSQDPLNIITSRFDRLSTNIRGGVAGLTTGAQIQVAHVVLGFESDIDWSGISGSATVRPALVGLPYGAVNASTNLRWESTARARVGYANENWLFYTTGGLALLGTKTTLTTIAGGSAVCGTILPNCTGANRQIGAVLGAGVEYGFSRNLSAKVEYLYVAASSLETSRHSELRAGLHYRFGGF